MFIQSVGVGIDVRYFDGGYIVGFVDCDFFCGRLAEYFKFKCRFIVGANAVDSVGKGVFVEIGNFRSVDFRTVQA